MLNCLSSHICFTRSSGDKTAQNDLLIVLFAQSFQARGLVQTIEGEPIITEEEFELLKQIRTLKMQYNHRLEEWKKLKEVVNYCRHMVELSRAKLLQEFDNWYQGCFVDTDSKNMDGNCPDTPSIPSVDQSNRSQNNNSTDSDRIERFQVAQFATFERCPEGRAYERAKENTIYQHIFKEIPPPKNLKSGLPRGIPVE
ncbi:hypothetical protein P879_04221 [Paragonimus westermani]|uniref:Kinesin-like protein KIF6/9 C-terminal domain-containing protein n=1 Tax=Paragonimus westermani TaxID=34504 RepID=A0A8T0DRT6_9TREM|nr:hypothetical protein P879_04221 [Paragonimus westermani]